ncbi:MAG: glycosyltransferase [Ktedonobacteraceae bacterium]|nr:glycosyltransferase [Ktedonobacteraceae bacterium]
MKRTRWPLLDRLSYSLATFFALDRLLKLLAVIHFFRRTRPSTIQNWPAVTLFQPITRGASGLPGNLRSRALLDYPANIQHLFICDRSDTYAQEECAALLKEFPSLQAKILVIETPANGIATKTEKLLFALPHATNEVFCFLDDDIALRPHAFRQMLPYLFQPAVGAVFGLACYSNWDTVWSSLMSAFVNGNALLSYVPITYLTEPFTITGHCYALQRTTFEKIGGFTHLEHRIDDDHELARRVRQANLRCVQTPMIYDVDNALPSLRAYMKQMKRWFIFPRQAMLPFMTPQEQGLSFLTSAGQLIPSLLALLTILTFRPSAFRALMATLGIFGAVQMICELCYLRRSTPFKRWPLFPLMAIIGPLQVLWTLLSKEEIEWRGQRLRIRIGGELEIVP